ncbi:MAG: T9SS type A sorting domain-containing protein, partial [Lentimicrobium sp.]|nr:T9SS type A sorting domain-containing protein [Lentimicrobium sp.]
TINIDQVDGALTNQAVYIEDKLTNTVFDLKTGNYTFNTVAGTFNDRFILRYTNKTLSNKDFETHETQVLVSNKNKQIKVNSKVETIDKVSVYDLLGRQLFKKEKVNSNELTIPNMVSGQQTLLVKVSLQNGQTVTKKIIY